MSTRRAITTAQAPAAAPVFHQGIQQGCLLQVSGQGPQDPATGHYLFPGDVAAQTRQTLANIVAILAAADASLDDVIMLRVYITDRADFAAMNQAYGEFVLAHCPSGVLPSRTTVVVGLPREDMLIEIDALAVIG